MMSPSRPLIPAPVRHLQVAPHAHRPDEMQNMASLSAGPGGDRPGLSGLTDDGDEYMDYLGGSSPLGLSSESSNQDRSCTSTPVGNDSSPAGRSHTLTQNKLSAACREQPKNGKTMRQSAGGPGPGLLACKHH